MLSFFCLQTNIIGHMKNFQNVAGSTFERQSHCRMFARIRGYRKTQSPDRKNMRIAFEFDKIG